MLGAPLGPVAEKSSFSPRWLVRANVARSDASRGLNKLFNRATPSPVWCVQNMLRHRLASGSQTQAPVECATTCSAGGGALEACGLKTRPAADGSLVQANKSERRRVAGSSRGGRPKIETNVTQLADGHKLRAQLHLTPFGALRQAGARAPSTACSRRRMGRGGRRFEEIVFGPARVGVSGESVFSLSTSLVLALFLSRRPQLVPGDADIPGGMSEGSTSRVAATNNHSNRPLGGTAGIQVKCSSFV